MFTDKTFVLVAHKFIPTLADDLKDFLVSKKAKQVFFITHDFAALETRVSHLQSYGDKPVRMSTPNFRWLPEFPIYIKDFVVTVWWLLNHIGSVDVYVGYGAFNVIPALIVKKFLKIKKIVFYTVDLAPNRFSNQILNKIYRWVDKIAMRGANEVWNLSPRMEEGREKLWNLKRKEYSNQFVVPLGVWEIDAKISNVSHEIFFSGHLMQKQGVQLIINALPLIIQKVPDVKLRIVGEGEYKHELISLVNKLNLECVVFEGKVDGTLQRKLMSQSGVAMAPYIPDADNFSVYADSAKIKTYLSAGLPIVMTDVTYNAKELEDMECAVIIGYEVSSLASATIKILNNSILQKKMKVNALKYIKNFDWNRILTSNFKRLLA